MPTVGVGNERGGEAGQGNGGARCGQAQPCQLRLRGGGAAPPPPKKEDAFSLARVGMGSAVGKVEG